MSALVKRARWSVLGLVVVLSACAGIQKGCAGCSAENFGSDWLIVQFSTAGEPMNCWRLSNTVVEHQSDGIDWLDPSGHIVHIGGWFNRVQIKSGDWDGAARSVGVDLAQCVGGKYRAVAP